MKDAEENLPTNIRVQKSKETTIVVNQNLLAHYNLFLSTPQITLYDIKILLYGFKVLRCRYQYFNSPYPFVSKPLQYPPVMKFTHFM